MLEKLLEANDNYDEPPPVDPSTLYSRDSDSDSAAELGGILFVIMILVTETLILWLYICVF